MIDSKAIRALRALIKQFTAPLEYHAKVRYRVVQKVVDRYHLQAVAKGKWPDQTYVSVKPGAAGYDASLALGSIVVVEFLEGDPTLPVITHFAGPGESGFTPISVAIAGADKAAAGVGDQVACFFPPLMPVTGTVSGAPFIGTVTIPSVIFGTIQTGSTKVKIGS
jgi:hypothetical protein